MPFGWCRRAARRRVLRGLVAASVLGTGVVVAVAGPASATAGCDSSTPALETLVTCSAGVSVALDTLTTPASASRVVFTVEGSGGAGLVSGAGTGGRGARVTGLMPVTGAATIGVRVAAARDGDAGDYSSLRLSGTLFALAGGGGEAGDADGGDGAAG